MLLQLQPGSVPDAPEQFAIPRRRVAWPGFVIAVVAVAAAGWLEFTGAVAREAASAPMVQMQLTSSGADQFVPLAEPMDPFLEQKRAAKIEELPAQF